MIVKKRLGWIILISIFLGLLFTYAVVLMYKYNVSFLCGLGLAIVLLSAYLLIPSLVLLAIEWITD